MVDVVAIFLSLNRNHCMQLAQSITIPGLGADIHYLSGLRKSGQMQTYVSFWVGEMVTLNEPRVRCNIFKTQKINKSIYMTLYNILFNENNSNIFINININKPSMQWLRWLSGLSHQTQVLVRVGLLVGRHGFRRLIERSILGTAWQLVTCHGSMTLLKRLVLEREHGFEYHTSEVLELILPYANQQDVMN